MNFFDFFQQNILLFGGAAATLAALVFLEYRGWQTRGANLSTSELSLQVNRGAALIDLRSKEDFRAGHIAGAKSIPFEDAQKHPENLGDKEADLVLYCHAGNQSATMVGKLRKLGYTNIHHLRGGMLAWQNETLPVTKKT